MKPSRIGEQGVLVLEDGSEYPGTLFGAQVAASSLQAAAGGATQRSNQRDRGYGEVVFNTSLTGYQEILTDPSYYGQIVCMTASHIGNTGINAEDPESQGVWAAGFVVHDACEVPSNWRSNGDLESYLKKHGVPGLSGVDTRSLTLRLRSSGVIRGLILPMAERAQAQALLRRMPPFEGRDLIGEVSTREAYRWNPEYGEGGPAPRSTALKPPLQVVAMDFGVKWNLLRSLEKLGCRIDVVPAGATAEEILARKPDGVFLSNGPGDPQAAPYAAKTVRELVGKVPMFGVCMGHQILALAMGAKTYKLKFGHRGGNQPVLDQESRRVEISSHNHGYAVAADSLPKGVVVTHLNLNDHTVEGLAVTGADAFSVQYHPEACPGPHDSIELFERFVKMMRQKAIRRDGDVSKVP